VRFDGVERVKFSVKEIECGEKFMTTRKRMISMAMTLIEMRRVMKKVYG